MFTKSLIIILITVFFSSCKTNDNTFYWNTETSEYKGIFDSKKISKEQIENISRLSSGRHFGCYSKTGLSDNEGLLDDTEIGKDSLVGIFNEYNLKKKEIEKLEIIPIPFWQNVKSKKMEEIDDEFELKRIVLEALNNPKVLYNNKFSKICPKYINIANITDEDILLKEWENLFINVETDKEYGKQHIKFFLSKYLNSKDRFIKAREEIIIFGYWHHTLEKLCEINDIDTSNEFEKLFLDVKKNRTY